jgi:hypothetical protein
VRKFDNGQKHGNNRFRTVNRVRNTSGTTMTEDQQAKQQISVAVDPELRERLENAARRAERSLSGEACFRLRRSFEPAQLDSDAA